jgi:serine/threonine protein kinase/tetratricopeptide (TPR) repeat protein
VLASKQFGSYQIIRKLARGMTDVYLVFDAETSRYAVLKIVEISPDSLTQLILEAERRGAELQRQLHDADSRVIEIYEYGEKDGCFFIAMQYIEGRTLAQILVEETRIEPARAARFAVEILSQLAQLHSFTAEIDGRPRSVVHGDIKPLNVQIGRDDEVRLLDFGIAKALTFTHSRTHMSLGSPSYCSPERLSRGQVDLQADLWAVGVTLYEMIAGLPPYQAEDTRKLEALIQSRRPPRALPSDCPSGLGAILNKALAGDMHLRYVSAAAFESDLRLFLQDRVPIAESERRVAWRTNPTLEKPRIRIPERVTNMAATVKRSVLKLKPDRAARVASVLSILVALCWGLFAGLLVCLPAGVYYRFWRDSGPLRRNADYTRAAIPAISSDWDLYQRIQRHNAFLGEFSPAARLGPPLRSNLLQAADEIIERYRNSSDPVIRDFDWAKAAACLDHALEMDRNDRAAQGKLALANGYLNFIRADGEVGKAQQATIQAAQDNFQRAAKLLPRSPDPHLGLARIYVYSIKNMGQAVAEIGEAEHLGFQPGPREREEEADGYRLRAKMELAQARQAHGKSSEAEERYLRLAHRDFELARDLYEPIQGFSNVSLALRQVDDDDRARQQLNDALKTDAVKKVTAKKPRNKIVRRATRWQ